MDLRVRRMTSVSGYAGRFQDRDCHDYRRLPSDRSNFHEHPRTQVDRFVLLHDSGRYPAQDDAYIWTKQGAHLGVSALQRLRSLRGGARPVEAAGGGPLPRQS